MHHHLINATVGVAVTKPSVAMGVCAVAEADAHRVRVNTGEGVKDADDHSTAPFRVGELDSRRTSIDRQLGRRAQHRLTHAVGSEQLYLVDAVSEPLRFD